jgi:hypothetical protein
MPRYAEPERAKPTYDGYFGLVLLTTVVFITGILLLYFKSDNYYGFTSEVKEPLNPPKVSQLKSQTTTPTTQAKGN